MPRRVLVCGGRDYADYWTVFEVLDGQHKSDPISCLIEGGALGADRFARRWATDRGVRLQTFDADWMKYGRSAGPIRNKAMLAVGRPDLVIAFPGGRGTANMVRQAREFDIPVLELHDGPQTSEA